MKCLFCDSEMNSGASNGVFMCPKCHVFVYMREKKLLVGKDAPDYLMDSYNCLSFIAKHKPDVTVAGNQLFTKKFSLNDVHMTFRSKRDVSNYYCPYTHSHYGLPYSIPMVNSTHLISIQNVVSYRFADILAANVSSIRSCDRVPLLTVDKCGADRYLWHAFVAKNINVPDVDKYVEAVYAFCANNVFDYFSEPPTAPSDEWFALVAAHYKDTRFRRISCEDGDWSKAAKRYYVGRLQLLNDNGVLNNYKLGLSNLCKSVNTVTEGQLKFAQEIMDSFARMRLNTREFCTNDFTCLIDPEVDGCMDNFVLGLLNTPDSSHSITEINRKYEYYAELYNKFVPKRSVMFSSLDSVLDHMRQVSYKCAS
ncbi:MAG: hypothetical protein NC548_30690 [Lachnospiraceae bacterium]|nr:hypothetical protein [Lachnospiraceae bacterium]